MLSFLNANKTKLIGVVLVALSYVQTNPALKDLVSDKTYAWTMLIVGLLVIVFGFLNNPPAPPSASTKEGGFARTSALGVLAGLAMLTVMVLGAGCASLNPVKAASTSEQKAYALYGSFVIFEEQAAKLYQSPTASARVKAALKAADAAAKPVADKLLDATQAVLAIKVEIAAGTSTTDKLVIALQNLDRYITEAGPKIKALGNAFKEAT